jgi:hypothetical protein
VAVLSIEDFVKAITMTLQKQVSVSSPYQTLSDFINSENGHLGLEKTVVHYQTFFNRFTKVVNTRNSTNKKVIQMINNEIDTETIKHFVILPNSRSRFLLGVIYSLGILYYLIYIPIRIMLTYNCQSYSSEKMQHLNLFSSIHQICLSSFDYSLVIDYFFDVIFLIEYLLRLKYFAYRCYCNDVEIIVTNQHQIYLKFCQSLKFKIGLLILFPFEIFNYYTGKIIFSVTN